VAYEADIFHGKVLSNSGSGGDGRILAAIGWAISNGCQVISMSLGRKIRPGETPMVAYETAGRRALAASSLIVAAAGNAALIAQQSSAFRGLALYRELRRRAQQLSLPARDVGNGLARAI